MTFLFADSFEGYDSATDMARKGWTFFGLPFISQVIRRDGTRSLITSVNQDAQWLLTAGTGDSACFLSIWFRTNYLPVSRELIGFRQGSVYHYLMANADSKYQFFRSGVGSGYVGDPSTVTVGVDEWIHLEVKYTHKDSLLANELQLKVNGTLEVDVAAGSDFLYAGAATCDGFNLRRATGSLDFHYWDAPVWWSTVAGDEWNDWKGKLRIHALHPNNYGDYGNFHKSDGGQLRYQLVDDGPGGPDLDATYVESSTLLDRDLYEIEDFGGVVDSIEGVQAIVVAKNTDASPRGLALFLKASGSYDVGGHHNLNTDYEFLTHQWDLNPITTVAWTSSDVSSAQVGIQVNS